MSYDATHAFLSETENREGLYFAMASAAAEFLRRVPGMTDQTLGRNMVDLVAGWAHDVEAGHRPRNVGWNDCQPAPLNRQMIREVAGAVGNFRDVREESVGASWRETVETWTGWVIYNGRGQVYRLTGPSEFDALRAVHEGFGAGSAEWAVKHEGWRVEPGPGMA